MTSVSAILNFEIYNFKTAKQTSRLNKSDCFCFFTVLAVRSHCYLLNDSAAKIIRIVMIMKCISKSKDLIGSKDSIDFTIMKKMSCSKG